MSEGADNPPKENEQNSPTFFAKSFGTFAEKVQRKPILQFQLQFQVEIQTSPETFFESYQ